MGELTIQVSNGPGSFFGSTVICVDAATGRCGLLEVGGVLGGRAGLVGMIFS
jgi:hypothetical protein